MTGKRNQKEENYTEKEERNDVYFLSFLTFSYFYFCLPNMILHRTYAWFTWMLSFQMLNKIYKSIYITVKQTCMIWTKNLGKTYIFTVYQMELEFHHVCLDNKFRRNIIQFYSRCFSWALVSRMEQSPYVVHRDVLKLVELFGYRWTRELFEGMRTFTY